MSDNGPAFKSDLFLRFILAGRALDHVRTRYRAPQTNGVVERWTGSLKYEHLYRLDIRSGHDLALECAAFRTTYNQVRPHEALAFSTPETVYLARPTSAPRTVGGRFAGMAFRVGSELIPDSAAVSGSKLIQVETVQKT